MQCSAATEVPGQTPWNRLSAMRWSTARFKPSRSAPAWRSTIGWSAWHGWTTWGWWRSTRDRSVSWSLRWRTKVPWWSWSTISWISWGSVVTSVIWRYRRTTPGRAARRKVRHWTWWRATERRMRPTWTWTYKIMYTQQDDRWDRCSTTERLQEPVQMVNIIQMKAHSAAHTLWWFRPKQWQSLVVDGPWSLVLP